MAQLETPKRVARAMKRRHFIEKKKKNWSGLMFEDWGECFFNFHIPVGDVQFGTGPMLRLRLYVSLPFYC